MSIVPKLEPGFKRTVQIEDLPLESSGVHSMLEDYYGFDPVESRMFNKFISDTALIESESGTVNPTSSARGIYQFMTTKGKGQNAFQTALNRTEKTYGTFGEDVPEWLHEARKHDDPNLLSEAEQRDVFLANLWKRKGTDDLFQKIVRGDLEAAMDLYMNYHHTGKTHKPTLKRARSIYGRAYKDSFTDYYGRNLI